MIIKQIPTFSDYWVDGVGNVYSDKRPGFGTKTRKVVGQPLKQLKIRSSMKHGRIVGLWKNGRQRSMRVGRLMLLTFVGPPKIGEECCHGSQGRMVDTLNNLQWGSCRKNQRDRFRDGTSPIGENNGKARLTWDKVFDIRQVYKRGFITLRQIAQQYGVRQACIWKIIHNKTWVV